MKVRSLIVVALVLGGCGGQEPAQQKAPAGTGWREQAEEACVKYVRFPGNPYAPAEKKAEVLEQLAWHERRTAIVTGATPRGADAAEYRRLVVEPAEALVETIRTARAKARTGKSPEFAYIDFSRERDDFEEGYWLAAEDLGLERCVDERVRTDERDTELRRSARFICEDTRQGFGALDSGSPMRDLKKAARHLDSAVRKLESLTPPPRTRGLWRETIRGVEDLDRQVSEMIDVIKRLPGLQSANVEAFKRELSAIERRVEAAARRAERGFRALQLDECEEIL